MRSVAIITARGGSKRIPRKNLRPFLGKPIIAYSIAAAIESGLFDEVMVSTDDAEIADVSRALGAAVPFMRSAKTSDDFATTADVLHEVIDDYAARGVMPDHACCIYPTAPFVTAEKLRRAYALLDERGADTVLPIARFSFPIWRSFRMEGDRVFYNWPEHAPRRSQDLPPAFQDTGQFYFFRPAVLKRTGLLITENTVGIEVPEMEAQDIDSEEDWALAEIKYARAVPTAQTASPEAH
jgi:pseudaminic acid cytidylyltransferase